MSGVNRRNGKFFFYLALSIIRDLHQTHCDPKKSNRKTGLSEDLQKIAADKGFIISDNPASGNCMFYALSEQLQSVKGIQISDRELRKKLVEFLGENPRLVRKQSTTVRADY